MADLALQGVHVSNQNVIYALVPQARSRVNSVYMTTYFVGAAVGSAVGSLAWRSAGWTGVCIAGAAFSIATALAWMLDRRWEKVQPRSPEAETVRG